MGGSDGIDRVFDVATRTMTFAVPGGQLHPFAVAFSPDNRTVVIAAQGGTEWLDTTTGRFIYKTTEAGGFTGVAYSPDGQFVAFSGYNTVQLWDAGTHEPITTLSLGNSGQWAQGISFSHYGGILGIGYAGTLELWNVAGLSHLAT